MRFQSFWWPYIHLLHSWLVLQLASLFSSFLEVVESFGELDDLSDKISNWNLEKIKSSWAKTVEPMNSNFTMLNNTELLVNNLLMFSDDVQFIDFLISFWGSSASDLLYFLILYAHDESKVMLSLMNWFKFIMKNWRNHCKSFKLTNKKFSFWMKFIKTCYLNCFNKGSIVKKFGEKKVLDTSKFPDRLVMHINYFVFSSQFEFDSSSPNCETWVRWRVGA